MTHPARFRSPRWARWFAAAGLALLGGCNILPAPTVDSTRYYVLTGGAVGPADRPMPATGLRIGLKPVALAAYLKGRPMVVRRGLNEIAFEDGQRWGEPLEAALARVLRARLLEEASVAQVYLTPFPLEGERDYDVEVQVIRCEGASAPGGGLVASFAAVIDVTATGPDHRSVAHRIFTAPDAPWDGKDFGRLAGELSADAAGLAQDIAAALPPKS
jgi:uncharacterized lipoprotein YmbA